MTPVQLPEVPARRDCVAFRWEGEPINEASDPPWKYASHWSTPPWDHRPIECLYTAAQLREYATITAQPYMRVLAEARRAIGDHIAPEHCYATGPMTGDPYRDLVECPACSFIAMYGALIAPPSETNSG